MAPKTTVHMLDSAGSRADRILWLLEELHIPYEVKIHHKKFYGFNSAPDSLRDLHSLAKTPLFEVDGKLYAESGAIIHHLLSTFPVPADVEAAAAATHESTYWTHFTEGSLFAYLQPLMAMGEGAKALTTAARKAGASDRAAGIDELSAWFRDSHRANTNKAFAEIEAFLAAHKGAWFSGTNKIGAGDFMLAVPLGTLATPGGRRVFTSIGPETVAWADRLRARPAWQRAQQRIKTELKAQPKLAAKL